MEILSAGLLLSFFAPFLVTVIFTLIGFFVGRAYGRRQGEYVGYRSGWDECDRMHRARSERASYWIANNDQEGGVNNG